MDLNLEKIKIIESLISESNYDEALKLINNLISSTGKNAVYQNIKGFILLRKNLPRESISEFQYAIDKVPNFVEALTNLGSAYRNIDELFLSIKCLKKALTYKNDHYEAHRIIGLNYFDIKDYLKSVKHFKELIRIDPANDINYIYLAETLFALNQVDEAIKNYHAALKIKNSESSRVRLGWCYLTLGKTEKAIHELLNAINLKKTYLEPYYYLFTYTNFQITTELESSLNKINYTQLDYEDKVLYNHIFFKINDSKNNLNEAFNFLKRGNDLVAKKTPFNEKDLLFKINRIKNVFEKIKPLKIKSDNKYKFIFIVGMPRSGSTLLEKIISSNKDIYALGEIGLLDNLISNLIKNIEKSQSTDEKIIEMINMIRNEYIKFCNQFSQKTIFTDKYLSNFFYVGIIAKIFPEAKIINIFRNEMAVKFSCYKAKFDPSKGLNWSFNKDSINQFYYHYNDLINFWKTKEVKNFLITDYDEIINNKEMQFKKIFDFLKINYKNDYLKVEKNIKVTKTASLSQVNKKIYSKPNTEWKTYNKFMNNFINK